LPDFAEIAEEILTYLACLADNSLAPEILFRNADESNLFFKECYALIKPASEHNLKSAPVQVVEKSSSKCKWCSRDLTILFDLDLTDSRLGFLGIPGKRLRVLVCDACCCFGTFFTQVDWNGSCDWGRWNLKPSYLPDDLDEWEYLPEHWLILSANKRGTFNAASISIEISCSQLGGYPSWVQDAEYPECPNCGLRMIFIAQLDREDCEAGEGILYSFLCKTCQVTATLYQQT